MTCFSTSSIALSLLVDLFFPKFLYICDIRSVFLYLIVVALITLLDDLFLFILMYTLVNGLFVILIVLVYFLFESFLDTLVFAGLFAVKCCHIGLLFACASSLTGLRLWCRQRHHFLGSFFYGGIFPSKIGPIAPS
jgi:hypothetical protein